MSPKVMKVIPIANYQLQLFFDNDEVRIFDVTPYLDKGIFVELREIDYFRKVEPFFGGVQWANEQDFSRDTLYLLSNPTPVCGSMGGGGGEIKN
jgi:Protein of unknown function (DUF2442)